MNNINIIKFLLIQFISVMIFLISLLVNEINISKKESYVREQDNFGIVLKEKIEIKKYDTYCVKQTKTECFKFDKKNKTFVKIEE